MIEICYALKILFKLEIKTSFEVKHIEIWAPAFLKDNNSSVATA